MAGSVSIYLYVELDKDLYQYIGIDTDIDIDTDSDKIYTRIYNLLYVFHFLQMWPGSIYIFIYKYGDLSWVSIRI